MKGTRAYENPLIPHARMRALYRALAETRVLGERMKPASVCRGLEACRVAPLIDLHAGDYVSDNLGGALAEHVRLAGLRDAAGAPRLADLRKTLSCRSQEFGGSAADRLLCATGAAMALKSLGRGDAVVAFAAKAALSASEWTRVLRIAGQGELPLVLVAIPGATSPERSPGVERLAKGTIPVIATDASDTIALYRVAQESLVRARAGGGAAVIDCVWTGADPLEVLARQLVERKAASARWITDVEPRVRTLTAKVRA